MLEFVESTRNSADTKNLMKFPDVLTGFLPKKEETKEYFFSLYLDIDAAAVAVWSIDPSGIPHVASFAHAVVADDSWESRIHVTDRLLSAAEEKVKGAKAITKTVFGMSGLYLTSDGNITDEVRPHLKKLSKMLELTPVGFVPLSQAIAFSLKKEEGVPPSVILIGCSKNIIRLSLFRVGQLTTDITFPLHDDPAAELEAMIKKYQDGEVLPSRMLIYGGNVPVLEEIRSKLLKHPWPTRVNFLHFPKIEIVSVETLVTSVSLAGASELASDIGENPEGDDTVSTVVAQAVPTHPTDTTPKAEEDEEEVKEVEDEDDDNEEEQDDQEGDDESEQDEEDEEDEEEDEGESFDNPQPDDDEDEAEEDELVVHAAAVETSTADTQDISEDEVSNVEVVTPESLGFRHEDVLEHAASGKAVMSAPRHEPKLSVALPKKFAIPHMSLDALKHIPKFTFTMPSMKRGVLPIVGGIVLIIILGAAGYYFLPKTTVTVLVASMSVDESTVLSVDPKSTIADPKGKIIPGKTQEQSVSGEKTVAITGKKNIGDPAKGTVTIYNKITSGRTFSKGTVLTTGGVAFTLDGDVSIASASESIGSITFGKATANVTAKDIGPNGNVSASSEFTFSNVSATSVSARNETAFTGGTSKQVTVVSRADQDALVKALTDELVSQAKQQLLTSGASGDRLIDSTIKTEVAEKVFNAELNQEAKELHGKVTIKVSGISVSDSDIQSVLLSLVEQKVPAGYRLAPEQTNVTTSNVTVKKDGTITLTAKLTAVSLPQIDSDGLKTKLVGKPVSEATQILRTTQGVAGAEYRFTLSPSESRLPINRNNITITVAVQ